MRKVLVVLVISGFFASCKTPQYTLENLPPPKLVFGKGGGFSGLSDEYTLLKSGQLFLKSSMTDSLEVLPKIKKQQVKALFASAEDLRMDTLQFNHPGNIYYFVNYVQDSTRKAEITWGDMNHQIPALIKEFHAQLYAAVKEKKKENSATK